ncbi:hypothetical protein Poli38472_013377 [Pythium oligandrum]|uniref:Uncharacterized protein n=1 Tax=Pythium oligandrum TaxID=41045 RepID=A0A8K1C7M4_PYTOL|nr:hypothetical protein Poli38472_013377 [Pythium oligandrum]|eukprot:TMW57903.1 hypothetical protein Poli38472_013377 [Pythium oligandrum]
MKVVEEQLPPLEPLPLSLTTEEKRARQRLHERRTYHRKLHRLQVLRNQVSQLEAEYESLLETKQLEEACAFVSELPAFSDDQEEQKPRVSDDYVELLRIRDSLQQHNEALRDAIDEYERSEKRIQLLLDWEASEEMASSSDSHPSASPEAASVLPALGTLITREQCCEIAQLTYAEIRRFRESPDFVTTGASVFGWRDKRQYDGDHVKFLLNKFFTGISTSDFMERAWGVMSSSTALASLYSASILVQVLPVQHVDDDNVIMLRVFSSPDGKRLIKSLFLVSRFEIATGYAVIYRSLDPSLMMPYDIPPDVQEQWVDYNSWIIYERAGDQQQHSRVSFGGKILKSLAVGSDALEMLFIAIRSEGLMLGTHWKLGN